MCLNISCVVLHISSALYCELNESCVGWPAGRHPSPCPFQCKHQHARTQLTRTNTANARTCRRRLQIQALNALFGGIAVRLNGWENHRTETEYEDALIGKVFVFKFINSFGSMCYVAFIKQVGAA